MQDESRICFLVISYHTSLGTSWTTGGLSELSAHESMEQFGVRAEYRIKFLWMGINGQWAARNNWNSCLNSYEAIKFPHSIGDFLCQPIDFDSFISMIVSPLPLNVLYAGNPPQIRFLQLEIFPKFDTISMVTMVTISPAELMLSGSWISSYGNRWLVHWVCANDSSRC